MGRCFQRTSVFPAAPRAALPLTGPPPRAPRVRRRGARWGEKDRALLERHTLTWFRSSTGACTCSTCACACTCACKSRCACPCACGMCMCMCVGKLAAEPAERDEAVVAAGSAMSAARPTYIRGGSINSRASFLVAPPPCGPLATRPLVSRAGPRLAGRPARPPIPFVRLPRHVRADAHQRAPPLSLTSRRCSWLVLP